MQNGKPHPYQLWSPRDDEYLRFLAARGASTRSAAKELGRSYQSVVCRSRRLDVHFRKGGRPFQPWTLSEDEALRGMAESGATSIAAARHLDNGRNARSVRRRGRQLGLKFADPISCQQQPGYVAWSAERDATATTMWTAGACASAIAKVLGGALTRNAVIGRMHRLGCHRLQREVRERPVRIPKPRIRAPRPVKPKVVRPVMTWGVRDWAGPPRPAMVLPPNRSSDVARVSLLDLSRQHCRWVVRAADATQQSAPVYCGLRREEGLPYCAAHNARAFNYVSPRPHHVYQMPDEFAAAERVK